jgi:uncharacterized damage-inducible protein DinB
MNYQNIAQIYAANDKIREKLRAAVENLSESETELRADAGEGGSEGWTIREIVEHLSIVENGMTRISARLLKQAEEAEKGETDNSGRARITESFLSRAREMQNRRFKAPDRVIPTGTQSIEESLAIMEENRRRLDELRPRFERIAASPELTFPHPFLGELNAHEWLALIGGHEARHLAQIRAILQRHRSPA